MLATGKLPVRRGRPARGAGAGRIRGATIALTPGRARNRKRRPLLAYPLQGSLMNSTSILRSLRRWSVLAAVLFASAVQAKVLDNFDAARRVTVTSLAPADTPVATSKVERVGEGASGRGGPFCGVVLLYLSVPPPCPATAGREDEALALGGRRRLLIPDLRCRGVPSILWNRWIWKTGKQERNPWSSGFPAFQIPTPPRLPCPPVLIAPRRRPPGDVLSVSGFV